MWEAGIDGSTLVFISELHPLAMVKILNFFQSNWFWIFYAIILILFSFTIFSNWVLMVSIWFGLFFTFKIAKLESKLSKKERRIYLFTAWLYPLVETGIKWMMVKNVVLYSSSLLNRVEHLSWAVAVVIIFLPTYTDIWKSLKGWQNMIFVIGLTNMIGNLNEFFEYLIRVAANLTENRYFAAFYGDTIYDMMMNMIGGLVGFLVLRWNGKPG